MHGCALMPLNGRREQGRRLRRKGKGGEQKAYAGAGGKAGGVIRCGCVFMRAGVLCLRMVHGGHGHLMMLSGGLSILRHAMGQRHQRRKHQCGSKKQVDQHARHESTIGQGWGQSPAFWQGCCRPPGSCQGISCPHST